MSESQSYQLVGGNSEMENDAKKSLIVRLLRRPPLILQIA
jgi:hypothetical protein